ncbi:hypothetical protein HCZ23_15790 [Celeribacter sp. HF31]|uniref:hypothetical protein n=1 Tax=Celeribacter sp. HF31 TaxID=2721558 RepID=UPI001431A7AE|nr:hypothetical protein [Celeribacter sp. HF31]NIY80925.1 hypothetical protein [Celeribacter sp. HF31]
MSMTEQADMSVSFANRVRIMRVQIVAMSVLAVFQLAIGSSILLTVVLWGIACVSALFLMQRSIRPSDVFVYLLGLYCGTFTLILKSMLGQKLQTNLVEPTASSAVMMIGFSSVMLAAILAKMLGGRYSSQISKRMNDLAENGVTFLPIILAFGLLSRFAFVLLVKASESGSSLGAYLNLFQPILMFGMFMALFHAARGSQLAKWGVISCLVSGVILTMLGNVKVETINMFMALFFGVLFLNLKIKFRHLFAISLVAYLAVSILAPAVQLARKDLAGVYAWQRIAATWDVIVDSGFSPATLARLQDQHFESFAYSYGPYNSYVYPSSANVDRFMMIFPTDQVMRSSQGAGGVSIADAVEEMGELILPSFLISKDPEALSDIVAWEAKIRSEGSIARPVIGLVASTVSISGSLNIVIIPFITILPTFLIMNYFFGNVNGLAFGALSCFFMMRLAEKEFERFYSMALRELPLLWVTCLLLLFVIHYMPRFVRHGERREAL